MKIVVHARTRRLRIVPKVVRMHSSRVTQLDKPATTSETNLLIHPRHQEFNLPNPSPIRTTHFFAVVFQHLL